MKLLVRTFILAFLTGMLAGTLLAISGLPLGWAIAVSAVIGLLCGSAFGRMTNRL